MAYEVIGTYGDPIPSTKKNEVYVVQAATVNGKEPRIEVRGCYLNEDGEPRSSVLFDRFGNKRGLAIVLDSVDKVDDLIQMLTEAKAVYGGTTKVTKTTKANAAGVVEKPTINRAAVARKKAASK